LNLDLKKILFFLRIKKFIERVLLNLCTWIFLSLILTYAAVNGFYDIMCMLKVVSSEN
jgi:hypothetical protein